jgi:hypothetical protein
MIKLKQKQIIIAIFATALLLASSGYSAESETKAALAGEDFIFTYTPLITGDAQVTRQDRINAIRDMMGAGMTHVVITFWPTVPMDASIQDYMNYAKNNGYKLALEISAGMCPYDGYSDASNDTVCFNSPELFEVEGDHGNQFLKAPCLCNGCDITNETIKTNWSDYVDKGRCENWNNRWAAIDPSYTGPLWQNTLANTAAVVARAKTLNYQPDIVLFDTEIWENPKGVESLFNNPSENCGCNVIQDGIREAAYYDAWKQRGQELAQAVKNVDGSIKVNFYNELPAGTRWIQEYDGQDVNVIGYMPSGTGDFAGPSLYVLPNLELLEKNINSMGLSGTLPNISPTYMYGYSNFFKYASMYGSRADALHFDTSVSREAGRMLRQAGTKGFAVYPNAYIAETWYGNGGYTYWLAHATALIAGFKEGADYVEQNKIRNPDFEAFKIKAPGFDWSTPAYVELRGSALKEPIQFAPVFWTWVDSNPSYKDRAEDANISLDKESRMYSWRHTRTGDIGKRTIYSRTFSIASSETGNYRFSIWTKASVNSSNGKIEFSLVNTNTLEVKNLGETSFATNWAEFKKEIDIAPGDYNAKIIINDNTGQTVDVFLDNASFEKATACGNGECEAALGETIGNCPQDCKCGNGTCDADETVSCPQDCPQECVDNEKLIGFIGQWKRGEMSMLALMQKIRQRNTGEGC